jgi:hypothetical protein
MTMGIGRIWAFIRPEIAGLLCRRAAAAAVAASMRTMPAMAPVPEEVHCDERHTKKNPKPVLSKPIHIELPVLVIEKFM